MNAPKSFTNEILIKCLSINPRNILKVDNIKIEKGCKAELTIFDKENTWIYDKKSNFSKSKNSPLLNTELTGKVLAIINKDQIIKN